MSDSTPCSWHSACMGVVGAGSGWGEAVVGDGDGDGASKVAEKEALSARERCVKAMDPTRRVL